MVECPICGKQVKESNINRHIDSNCSSFLDGSSPTTSQEVIGEPKHTPISSFFSRTPEPKHTPVSSFFSRTPAPKKIPVAASLTNGKAGGAATKSESDGDTGSGSPGLKRSFEDAALQTKETKSVEPEISTATKRPKMMSALQKAAPLAERMRPQTLDEIYGQELVGPNGVLRGLIETDRVPSMILWGGAGTGKTTIARVIANMVGSRFIEINSTSSGVGECKKIFAEAKAELGLAGRKTILFCDEIHRFSKSQQDVFLGPVESGQVTLIGATTENPSFKVQSALLSRCRTFTLQKLTDEQIVTILSHALEIEGPNYNPSSSLLNPPLLTYLSAFSDGDARTALNLLELAMDLSTRPSMTPSLLKSSLTQTLVYDRMGDQHYQTISAFHKSIRGSDPDAALYYLARMLQSGEDPLYIARRLIVVASEDVGLADNTLLSLATGAYAAAEKIGMPEAKINLAHATVALALAPKSTRVYRGLGNAEAVLKEPGVAGLAIPLHLRNAPTRLMKELGYGKEYKYNPRFRGGKVAQTYLPEGLLGKRFLEERDLGEEVDVGYEEPG